MTSAETMNLKPKTHKHEQNISYKASIRHYIPFEASVQGKDESATTIVIL